ncbi:hypothetical protein [Rhizobium laguerreae]|uniref:hypothetical protein n=1 Tax=Rhizobium laguerreae TaxID=1076926 RepID=UPI00300CE8A5
MTEKYQPKYKWRPTSWPGDVDGDGRPLQDFTGFDGNQSFGRILVDQLTTSRMGTWKWNVAHIPWVRST